jgi:hypothetical protein
MVPGLSPPTARRGAIRTAGVSRRSWTHRQRRGRTQVAHKSHTGAPDEAGAPPSLSSRVLAISRRAPRPSIPPESVALHAQRDSGGTSQDCSFGLFAAASIEVIELADTAALEGQQPRPGRERGCWFVAPAATSSPVLLQSGAGPEHKQEGRPAQPMTWPLVRGSRKSERRAARATRGAPQRDGRR